MRRHVVRRGAGPGAGFTLVSLMASISLLLILMAAAVPTWRQIVQDDREEEMIFRGGQIADAIARYQRRNGNALPTSLEVLVQQKHLRRLYKDPMTKDGKWRLVRQGEIVVPIGLPGGPGIPGRPGPSPTPRPSGPGAPAGTGFGPIVGVASTSTEKSLRLFNGRSHYNEWIFAVGQPRVVGRTPILGPPTMASPSGPLPGPTPIRQR